MTSTATPISAATEQEHHHDYNQNQFHGISPLRAGNICRIPKHSTASSKCCSAVSAPDLIMWAMSDEQFCSVFT
jgi:hypothetical protein